MTIMVFFLYVYPTLGLKKICILFFAMLTYFQILFFQRGGKSMKKSLKTLVFATMTVGMLAACNQSAPANWSKEDKALMQENLHGIVLPYLNSKGVTVEFNEKQKAVEVKGPELDAKALEKFASLFSEKNGWGEFPEYEPEEGEYAFRTSVETEDGKRFVAVSFMNEAVDQTLESGAEDPTGADESPAKEFVLRAGDPYAYKFEDAPLLDVVLENFAKLDTVPAFEGAEYFWSDLVYDDEDNFEALDIQAKGVASDPSTAYAAALSQAGYYPFGDSAHQELNVTYEYSAEKKQFDIYVSPYTIGFPIIEVNEYLAKTFVGDGETLDAFPAFNDFTLNEHLQGYVPLFSRGYNQLVVAFDDATVSQEFVTSINAFLKTKGFTEGLVQYGWESRVSPNEQYEVVAWVASSGYAYIDFQEVTEPVLEWPTEQLATDFETLGLDTSTPLPAYPGEFTNVTYNFDEEGREITIILSMDADPGLATVYVPLMSDFTLDTTGTSGDITYWDYVSPENSYKVEFYYGADLGGVLFIINAFYDKVPVDNMKSDLECEDSTFDLFVPSFEVEGAYWYYYFSSRYYQSNGLYMVILEATLESAEAVTAAITDITGQFTELGYQEGQQGDIFMADFSAGKYLTRVWIEADDKNDCKLSITIYWFADAIENYVNPQEAE